LCHIIYNHSKYFTSWDNDGFTLGLRTLAHPQFYSQTYSSKLQAHHASQACRISRPISNPDTWGTWV